MKPLLSIIIPSRNRQKYAMSCIRSILAINDDRIEIVVHDNSDSNELETFILKNIDDKRLVYKYDSSLLSTIANFNKSIKFANGEYICFIGDDDGVNLGILDVVLWAKKMQLDAIFSKNNVGYKWPNEEHNGNIVIYPFTGKYENIDVKKELIKFMQSGGVYYLKFNLPKAYHGVVKRECFDKVHSKLGYYFGGLSPDIFASISISFFAKNVVAIDYPLTIAGSSPISDLTHRTKSARTKELKNAPHFRGIDNYQWSKLIPSVYSGETIWAETAITAMELLNEDGFIKKQNKYKLVSSVIKKYPHYKNRILNNFLNEKGFIINVKIYYYKYNAEVVNIVLKLNNKLLKTISNTKTIKTRNVINIEEATLVLDEYIKKCKLSKLLNE